MTSLETIGPQPINRGDAAVLQAVRVIVADAMLRYEDEVESVSTKVAEVILRKRLEDPGHLADEGEFMAFVRQSARNAKLNLARERRRDLRRFDSIEHHPSVTDGENEVNRVEQADLRELMAKEIAEMPPRRREAARLVLVDRMAVADVAARLGITEKSVRNSVDVAKEELRPVLEAYRRGLI